jgi:IS1 family transposase
MFALPFEARVAVVSHLVEGNGIRATERLTGVTKKTILRMLADIGEGCGNLHDRLVRDLSIASVQCDEIWSYVQKKQARVQPTDDPTWGDLYTFVGLATASKLVIAYHVGKRDQTSTDIFMRDLRARLLVVPSIFTDAFAGYRTAVGQNFETVDYGQVVKNYSKNPRRVRDGQPSDHRYEPPRDPFITRTAIYGTPDPTHISTSHVERQNLTMRMQIRRFTRLCNGFSKKATNHAHAVALHFAYYNFCRIHETIRCTPAMEAGITDHVWTIPELVSAVLSEPAGDKPVKVAFRMPEPMQGTPAPPARALPGGRGFLRLVQGGNAPQSPTPSPSPATPAPTSPAPVLREVPQPWKQLDLFGIDD